eukprot:3118722-Amphidinium_carterae.1
MGRFGGALSTAQATHVYSNQSTSNAESSLQILQSESYACWQLLSSDLEVALSQYQTSPTIPGVREVSGALNELLNMRKYCSTQQPSVRQN